MAISQTFEFKGYLETFDIPANVLTLDIEAIGACGGNNTTPIPGHLPGYGSSMKGIFYVTPQEKLSILVGERGGSAHTGGGGGGSFVWLGSGNLSQNNLLIAAGGGGGIGGAYNGMNASLDTAGTSAANTGNGGINGNGGSGGVGSPNPLGQGAGAGGGGGLLTSGGNGLDGWDTTNSYGLGGQGIILGGAGGAAGPGLPNRGGFGGGGGGAAFAGGAGGGYSGGGGGSGISGAPGGGGGGSYNSSTLFQLNTPALGTDHGKVIITYGLIAANFTFSPTSALSHQLTTFDASSSTADLGYTIDSYSWNFGDGTSGTGRITTHIYDYSGSYTVTLLLTGTNNYMSVARKTIKITSLTRGISFFN